MVLQTSFVASAEMCGACHSLFNPAESAHDETGTPYPFPYYEQRTYEEWKDSKAARDNVTCIDCHMKVAQGAAVRDGETYDDLAVHSFVGGNIFAVDAVRVLYPELALGRAANQVRTWVKESLESAAELSTTTGPVDVESGQSFPVEVRLTNKTGHKLPSGYPEGRRVFLAVDLELDGSTTETLTGFWDDATGVLVPDRQLRTYETEHGRYENGTSFRTRRLLLMNQILSDTRLPPEGFTPSFPDMIPVGRDYGNAPPYRHWDDISYTFTAPEVSALAQGNLRVRAMYQETDGDVVRFLMGAAAGTDAVTDLETVWGQLGHAPPHEMVSLSIPITIRPSSSSNPDAGMPMSADGGVSEEKDSGFGLGCLSAITPGSSFGPTMMMMAFAVGVRRIRSSRSRSQSRDRTV